MKLRSRVLAFLFGFAIITFVDRVCIAVAGTAMQHDLAISPQQWGWMLGLFSLAYGAFEMPVGALADRLGPRVVLTRIVSCWSVFTILTGAVTRYWQLVVVRFLFGAGEAGAFPGCSAVIVRWFPVRERAFAQGIVFMGSRVGGAMTPFLVLPLLEAWGWRACFYVFGVVGLLWPLAWYRWFRDRPADMPGITPAEREELAETAAGARAEHGLPWRAFRRNRSLRWILVMYFACCWTAFFYLSWLHTFLEKGRGFSRADLLALAWLPFVLGATACFCGGRVGDWLVRKRGLKWGRRIVGVAGLGASACFIGAALGTEDKVGTIVFLALGYAGADFMLPVAWATCLDIGGRHAGAVTGAMNMAGQAGAFTTSVAFGYIVAVTGRWDAPLWPMMIVTALGALAWLRIDPTETLGKTAGDLCDKSH